MIFNIKGLGSAKGVDKTKAKTSTGATGGPSFAQMLEGAQHSEEVATDAPVEAYTSGFAGNYVPVDDEDFPKDAKGQAREMLKTLQNLAHDALSGSPTATVNRLEALAAEFDESNLSDEQKKALDEIRTRAAVEVAKLKS